VIYVYAIGERGGELVPFVRRDVERAPAPDEESLRAHDEVVATLMKEGAVLPMRFGTVAQSEEDVRELLARRGEELRGQLAHVRGRVELGVRAAAEQAPVVPTTGGEFMRAKAERRAAAKRQVAELDAAIEQLTVDRVVHLIPRDDTAFTASYLVDESDAEAFTARASGYATVTGPWPPYSFSG
jgi:hypothetical protein